MLMLANDASPHVVRQHHLAQAAIKDLLTGLPNKLALMQELDASIDLQEKVDLIVIGLDRFKTVNDELGFAGGDMVLLEVASRMQSATRAGERLFRLNGDEFALLTTHDPKRRWLAAEAMLATTKQPFEIAGNLFVLGASAGGVSGDIEHADGETLLKWASLALHESKRRARGQLVPFDPHMEDSAHKRAKLESELRRALERNELVAHLQPQGSLATGELVGAEALVRWQHPTLGLLPPADFLPVARDCGLMKDIDFQMLDRAIAGIVELGRHGIAVPISINLSVEAIASPQIVERVAQSLELSGVSPGLLQVEIPEDALMKDVRASAQTLERLSAMGVRIAIDDFGTGYSSFAYLAKFPVSALKIDRSFVRDMATGPAARKIVRGIARLAHSLNLEVVAEGAETSEEIQALKVMQCDTVQGYGYGRPMSLPDFLAFALRHSPRPRAESPSAFSI